MCSVANSLVLYLFNSLSCSVLFSLVWVSINKQSLQCLFIGIAGIFLFKDVSALDYLILLLRSEA